MATGKEPAPTEWYWWRRDAQEAQAELDSQEADRESDREADRRLAMGMED